MKITHNPDVERAELAVEAHLSKFSSAVDHLEDKINEGRANVQTKVDKVKNIVNKPKNIMSQVSEKAHSMSGKVSGRAHGLSDRVQQIAVPYKDRGFDLGKRFWHRAEAHPVPFAIGAAVLFSGLIYWMLNRSREIEEPNLGL